MQTKEEISRKMQKIELPLTLATFVIIIVSVFLLKVNMTMNIVLFILACFMNFLLDPILKNIAIRKYPNVPKIETLRISKYKSIYKYE
ncbi:hypothetical protein DY037_05280 [Apilactobacillus micheneri]|uniref:hypothetical protein n=1 Tax=Apilactobacillus micheneri TaxID=1899430 RepID=UPI00112EB004|nr:hypothetical protein [Apilactobacillus micheneri]TPR49192.1 hypothetical protein DY037_05280 [Apilactobacillus micheneri]